MQVQDERGDACQVAWDFFRRYRDWYRDNKDALAVAEVDAELRESDGNLPLNSASIQFASRESAWLAVVWESGAAETIHASGITFEAPVVVVHQLESPEQVGRILDRVKADLLGTQ